MKLSELTERDVGIYCRIEGEDVALVPAYIDAAKSFILRQTGLSEDEADERPELTIAALALLGDFYEKRTMSDETATENRTVAAIIGMHCRHLVAGDGSEE